MVAVTAASKRLVGTAQLAWCRRHSQTGQDDGCSRAPPWLRM